MGLNAALATASNALQLYSLGVQVSGNNIANASTPGYIRERLNIYPSAPYQVGSVLVGSGAQAGGVRQVFDRFLESRMQASMTDASAAETRSNAYLQLETAFGELGDGDLSTSLNNFIQAVQNASNQPDSTAFRNIVIQQGQQFTSDVTSLRSRINKLQETYSQQMSALVDEANRLIQEVADLNPQIGRLEANGLGLSDAGTLRVQRQNALNRLAEMMPIRVQENSSGAVDVFTDADFLILGGYTQKLQAVVAPTESGVSEINVQTTVTKATIGPNGGELGGLIEARDRINVDVLKDLDQFVGAVIYEFNRQHSSGEGTVGFGQVTSTNFVSDPAASLNQAGLAFPPQHGSFVLKVVNTSTGATEQHLVQIDLDSSGTDTSLNSLATTLSSLGNVAATVTGEGRLQLSSGAGYELRFGSDTSGVLASLGINTFFTGNSSDNIAVNQTIVKDNRLLATGQGGGAGDNTNALALAQVFDRASSRLQSVSVNDFYTNLVGRLGQASAAEQALAEGSASFRDSLKQQREQKSGVSVDEEAIQILQLQRNYQAAARIVSTIDQLLNTLLQI